MVGQAEIIIQTPNKALFSTEYHFRTDFTFQFWKGEVAMRVFRVLTDRTAILLNFFKQIHDVLLFVEAFR
jgi:hypothetical protein